MYLLNLIKKYFRFFSKKKEELPIKSEVNSIKREESENFISINIKSLKDDPDISYLICSHVNSKNALDLFEKIEKKFNGKIVSVMINKGFEENFIVLRKEK